MVESRGLVNCQNRTVHYVAIVLNFYASRLYFSQVILCESWVTLIICILNWINADKNWIMHSLRKYLLSNSKLIIFLAYAIHLRTCNGARKLFTTNALPQQHFELPNTSLYLFCIYVCLCKQTSNGYNGISYHQTYKSNSVTLLYQVLNDW